MKVVKRIVAKNGTFKDKNGEEKARWLNCGVLMKDGDKERIKLDCIPTNFDGWFNLFDMEDDKSE